MHVESFLFKGTGKSGARLVIFGAIHGNELCGPAAIARVMEKIRRNEIIIARGSVLFVPVCNPRAYARGVRQTEENLNRVFRKTETPATYEALLANELCDLMEREADMFLDIHSTSAPGPTSVFIDYPTPENERFAAALDASYALLDWPAVYENNVHGFDSYDTTRFAYEAGIAGVLIECGQHEDPHSTNVAEDAIIRALAHANIVEIPCNPPRSPRRIRMKTLEKKMGAGDSFARAWAHLDTIQSGALIATRDNGEELRAKEECIMLLPKHHALPGEEWFYLGVAA